jgi:hypothetical protein
MSARRRLANRHESETFSYKHGEHKFHASVSRFDDGLPAEIFLNTGKAGSDAQLFMRDASILLSLLLQYGADLDSIGRSLTRNPNGSAASAVGRAVDIVRKEKRHADVPEQPVASGSNPPGNQSGGG